MEHYVDKLLVSHCFIYHVCSISRAEADFQHWAGWVRRWCHLQGWSPSCGSLEEFHAIPRRWGCGHQTGRSHFSGCSKGTSSPEPLLNVPASLTTSSIYNFLLIANWCYCLYQLYTLQVQLDWLGGKYGDCVDTTKSNTDINVYEQLYPWTKYTREVSSHGGILFFATFLCQPGFTQFSEQQ